MSLVEEVLGPIPAEELARGLIHAEETPLDRAGLTFTKFAAHIGRLVAALLLGGRLEGYQPVRVRVSIDSGEIPEARALIEFNGVTFVLYAKPYMDVEGVDAAADYVAEVAEEVGGEVVAVLAAMEYSFYAEKYAKSLGFEAVKLSA